MAGNGPQRPPSVNTSIDLLNGVPTYLGTLVSSGAGVNNLTTSVPFLGTPLQAVPTSTGGQNMVGSLAGKVLLIQSTAAGYILPSFSSTVNIASQAFPVAQGTSPGVLIGANVPQIVIMNSMAGWMQWLPVSGAGNLLVWELV